jgi:hypothetical protein
MRQPRSSRPPSVRDGLVPVIVILALALLIGVAPAHAQGVGTSPTRREIAALPALAFDADEGLGYGAILQVVDYGRAGARPYRWMLQPTYLRATRGKQEIILFADAPALLPDGWRLTALAGLEDLRAAPYYGIGNATVRDETLEEEDEGYYYRFERRQLRVAADLQRAVAGPLRLLIGAGGTRARVGAHPHDAERTLLALDMAEPSRETTAGWIRVGLVLDTRDREIGPSRGRWAELLLQRADRSLGGDTEFTRATATWREYLPVGDRATLAARAKVQQVSGEAPFHELSTVASSFRQTEGLGGAGSVRGLPRNRYIGKGLALYATELRWRAGAVRVAGAPRPVVLSAFADVGRVWSDRVRISELASDLHVGYGGGARVAVKPGFVVALDVGHSKESAAPVYIGLGYAF